MAEPVSTYPNASDWSEPDIKLGTILGALWRRRLWIVGAVGGALGLGLAIIAVVPARYSSEARVLIERNENAFSKPLQERDLIQIDKEATASQVQLLLSRDLAKTVAAKLKLADNREFGAPASISPLELVLQKVGLSRRSSLSPEEQVLEAYYDHLGVAQITDSRVITVEFRSKNPEFAAKAANTLVDSYIELQRDAKRDATRQASTWLGTEIERLRRKVEDAEQKVEDFRAKSGLLIGSNNTTLNAQRLSEVNTQLAQAQAQRSQAQAKADTVRALLRSGRQLDAAADVLNSPLIQRLMEQQVTLRAQIAQLSTTLLPGHPRLREFNAHLADLQTQTRLEAEKIVQGLENEAKLAKAREDSLTASLDGLKAEAGKITDQEVQLRALDREARAQRELLESFLARYREASARENFEALPPDARIISRATVPSSPSFPKPAPLLAALAAAAFLLSAGLITTLELVSGRGPVPPTPRPEPAPRLPEAVSATVTPLRPEPRPAAATARLSSLDELAAAVERAWGGRGAQRVMVAGAVPETAAALALGFGRHLARRGQRVVLVDAAADEHRLSDSFGDRQEPGLAELLREETSFATALVRDRVSRLHLLPLGTQREGLADLLGSERMELVLAALQNTYDVVVVHIGAPAGSAAALAKVSHHVVFAATPEATEENVAEACAALVESGAPEVSVFVVDFAAASAA